MTDIWFDDPTMGRFCGYVFRTSIEAEWVLISEELSPEEEMMNLWKKEDLNDANKD